MSAGLHTAVASADRARLTRFLTIAAPRQTYWHAGERVTADALSTGRLRNEAFCAALDFHDKRRTARFWRGFHGSHRGAPAGCTTVPSYRGAALDRWIAQPDLLSLDIAA